MKTSIITTLCLFFSLTLFAQKIQLREFQRYPFGSLEHYIVKDNKYENKNLLQSFSISPSLTKHAYFTKLIDFDATVRYSFENGKLYAINYHSNCKIQFNQETYNDPNYHCDRITLKEFFDLKRILNEIFGSGSICSPCNTCVTKYIPIPEEFNEDFESNLKRISADYPNNNGICIKWADYTNNSSITLYYNSQIGWALALLENSYFIDRH